MRALVIDPRTAFMQAADVFEKGKVIFQDIELAYIVDDKKIVDEESVSYLAKQEFKDKLIALLGMNKPFYINPEIQTISNGRNFTTLYDFLCRQYPSLQFSSDNYFKNITVNQ